MWDNPVPDDEKPCFNFTVKMNVTATGYIFANNIEEARELIQSQEWDEIEVDSSTYDVIDIDEVVED